MCGEDLQQSALFSYLSPEQRVPKDHPLRKLLPRVDAALAGMLRRFPAIYARGGRPSIAPEKLLRALLLRFSAACAASGCLWSAWINDLLFRWFVGLNLDDPVWDATVSSKNRERLLSSDVAGAFFRQVGAQACQLDLLSDEHFTVDGTLIEAWASQKSFKPQAGGEAEPPAEGRNPEVHLRGEKRRNDI
ncbi:MAG: transposase, partial [Terriglobia bacterium]